MKLETRSLVASALCSYYCNHWLTGGGGGGGVDLTPDPYAGDNGG